jgi:4-diphosphocytidyl-2-C-methyl-D-erythritol kinase
MENAVMNDKSEKPSGTVSLRAVSKINLLLEIKDKRPDGYHEIRTLFFPLKNPSDTVSVSFDAPPGTIEIVCAHPEVPSDSRNLCWKAASKYAAAAAVAPSWRIAIEKNIPVAGGMGGGSSDAAAVLLLLNRTFNALEADALSKIALSVGADVPFFLNPVPSSAGGVGETLEPAGVPAEPPPLVMVSHLFPVSAAWAYKHASIPDRRGRPDAMPEMLRALKDKDWKKLAPLVHNDLALAVFKKFPVLEMTRALMLETGALTVELSGSGPAVFGVYESPASAAESARALRSNFGPSPAIFTPA